MRAFCLTKADRSCMAASCLMILSLFSSCARSPATAPELLGRAISLAADQGRWKEALELATAACKADPQSIDAIVMTALCLEQLGKTDDAITLLLPKTDKLKPHFLGSYTLGRLLLGKNDYEKAFEFLDKAHSLRPDSVDTLALLARCAAKKHLANTPALLLKLLKTPRFKDSAVLYNELGVYFLQMSQPQNALVHLTKAYNLDPQNPIISGNLAVLHDKFLKSPQKAKGYYQSFITLAQNNSLFTAKVKLAQRRMQVLR